MTRKSPRGGRVGTARRQEGAVLIVAMILLVILTLLGVSAMNTTQLEEKMAANSQEATRAFQTAESALTEAYENAFAWDVTGYATTNVSIPGTVDMGQYQGTFLGWSPPPIGTLYSATSFQAANFDFRSRGQTGGGNTVNLHGGAYQIAPKSN